MGPIGHCAIGMAAKPLASKVPVGVLLLATLLLDILAIVLMFFGIEGGEKVGNPWSHGLLHVADMVHYRRTPCGDGVSKPPGGRCGGKCGIQPLDIGSGIASDSISEFFLAYLAMDLWASSST